MPYRPFWALECGRYRCGDAGNFGVEVGFKKDTKERLVGFSTVAAQRLDIVGMKNPEAARVLIKMTAEVEICQSLAAGILVFFVFRYFIPPHDAPEFTYPIKAFAAGTVLFILLLLASCFRLATYWARLYHIHTISQRNPPFPNSFQTF
jgi:hypothetical protein